MIHLTARERIELHAHAAIDDWRRSGCRYRAPMLPPPDRTAIAGLRRLHYLTHTGAELLTDAGRRALEREMP